MTIQSNLNVMNSKIILLIFFIISACTSDKEKKLFTDISSKQTQINFINAIEDSKSMNALDYMYFYDGGGVSIGDINNDGLPDIYFTGNKVSNKLYLNKGNFKFEDITENAGVEGASDWNTGTVMADVNGDGFLDIYVCAVVGILGFKGHNELFINNGDLTFSEQSAQYNLDIKSQANNVAFFDYDKDGDLDLYLLNEGKHSAESFGPASNRLIISEGNGDRLLRNDNGMFVNVSQEAGIYSGVNSYGLGVAIADFNNDGWDDIYVGNDFHEDDYYYINNKDGTFSEQLRSHFGKVSLYSMGNDVADINHDGYPDLITLDMMSEDEHIMKSTFNSKYHKLRENWGYYPQFNRNMLQINQKGEYFTDIALFSGVASTDWSWAPLFADYDQDGELDLFITNGIFRRVNDLDYLKIYTDIVTRKNTSATKLSDQNILDLMPKGAIHNYFYKGNPNLKFDDKSDAWYNKIATLSSGAAFADLDNDGDLDLIINNYNAKPSILKNNSKNKTYLKLNFNADSKNRFALGTKVIAYNNANLQFRQLYTTRGFQSSVEPIVHFGFDTVQEIDSLLVIWPDNTSQLLKNVKTNQTLTIKPSIHRKSINHETLFKKRAPWFKKIRDTTFVNINHIENNFSELSIYPLMPYKISTQGPAFAIADVNNDGKKDIFIGGASGYEAKLYVQVDDDMKWIEDPVFNEDAISEDVDAIFFDCDNDGDLDLMVVTGGNQYFNKSEPLKDRLYFNNGKGEFSKASDALPAYYENGSIVRINDIDQDGDIDMFIGARAVAGKFGDLPESYLLLNNGKGKFSIDKSVLTDSLGMVTDAVFTDFNNDGVDDLIVVGEWMAPQFFKNEKGIFKNVTNDIAQSDNTGLWQAIYPFDIDGDGDLDYLLGNWGLNSKFKASDKYPLRMHVGDFNNDGKTETLLSFAKRNVYYSINDKDELDAELGDMIKSKFKSYKEFAGKSFDKIFNKAVLRKARLKNVTNLSSGYLKNDNGKFKFIPFKEILQRSPITCFLRSDFNIDGTEEVLLGGNFFGVTPYNGKLDENIGYILQQNSDIISGIDVGVNFGNKEVKHLNLITINGIDYLLATVNKGKTLVYEIVKNK